MASGTWTSVATSGAWNTTTNWSGGTVASGTGFTATFSSNITATTTIDTTTGVNWTGTIGNITFSDNGAAGSAWTLGSQAAITLAVSSGSSTITTTTDATINGALTGSSPFIKAGTGTLVLTGANTFSGGTTVSAGTLQIGASSTATPITSGPFGTGTITTSGTTSLYSNVNSGGASRSIYNPFVFAGTVTLGNATLNGVVNFYGAVSSSANLTLLTVYPFVSTVTLTGGTFSIQTGQYNSLGIATITTLTVQTGATLSADNTINNAHNVGAVVMAGGLLTSINGPSGAANDGGNGNWILNSGMTCTASSTVSSTTFGIKSGNLDVSSGATLTISSAITNSGATASNVSKTNTGTLTLTGSNTFTGSVTVSAGTLNANSATAPALGADTSSVTVSSGATLSLGGGSNMTYATRTLALNGTGATAGVTGALVIADTTTKTFTAGINLNASGANYVRATDSGTLASTTGIATTATNNLVLGADSGKTFTVSALIKGAGSLTVGNQSGDSGTVVLSGANTYTGTTTLASGTARANVAQVGTTSGPFGASGTINMTGGTLQYSASNTTDFSGRFSSAGNQTWKIDVPTGLSVSWASGTLSGSFCTLTKYGAGTLNLQQPAGTQVSGQVTVSSGTLISWFSTSLGLDASNVRVETGATLRLVTAVTYASRFLALAGGEVQIAGTGVRQFSAVQLYAPSRIYVYNGGSPSLTGSTDLAFSTLSIDVVGGMTFTVSSAITNAGGSGGTLAINSSLDSGTVLLAVASSYGGGTTVSSGTVKTANISAVGTGNVTVAGSARLQTATSTSGKLTVGGTLTMQSGSILRIGG